MNFSLQYSNHFLKWVWLLSWCNLEKFLRNKNLKFHENPEEKDKRKQTSFQETDCLQASDVTWPQLKSLPWPQREGDSPGCTGARQELYLWWTDNFCISPTAPRWEWDYPWWLSCSCPNHWWLGRSGQGRWQRTSYSSQVSLNQEEPNSSRTWKPHPGSLILCWVGFCDGILHFQPQPNDIMLWDFWARREHILHVNRMLIIVARRQYVKTEKVVSVWALPTIWQTLFNHVLNLGSHNTQLWPPEHGRNDVWV